MTMKPANIRDHWGTVRPQLERLQYRERRRGIALGWIPEDIYAACVNKQAFFYKAPTHWAVLKESHTELGKELYVWVGHSDRPGETLIGALHEDVIELGQQIGAAYVTFTTTRKGFEPVTRAYGWLPEYTKYVYPLVPLPPEP